MINKKIFLLTENDDNDRDFASFIIRGTYKPENICRRCRSSITNVPFHVEPYQIEWEDGSNKIGDFNYDFYNIVIKERVKRYLQRENFECNFGKIEILPPESKKKRVKIVEHPYKGESLFFLKPNKTLNLDVEKSGLNVKLDCSECGSSVYHFKKEGIVISGKVWNGEKIFKISQFGSITYITEGGLKDILSQNFSNFGYIEAGIIE